MSFSFTPPKSVSFSANNLLEKCLLLLIQRGWRNFCFRELMAQHPHVDAWTLFRLFPEKNHIMTAFFQKTAHHMFQILKKRRPFHAQEVFIEGILTTMDLLEPFFSLMQEILYEATLSISTLFQWIHPFYHHFYTFAVFHTSLSHNESTILSLLMTHGLLSSLCYKTNHGEEEVWGHIHNLSLGIWF